MWVFACQNTDRGFQRVMYIKQFNYKDQCMFQLLYWCEVPKPIITLIIILVKHNIACVLPVTPKPSAGVIFKLDCLSTAQINLTNIKLD